ncbi:MAG: NAD(P)/FAD-dependent oxidoreductase [Aigarchaeota archaeon]|nr:NAD(P)/FAD-dependent oxidoreductase [Aigarchaeota archaeon]MCX8193529.1 NAD(P)/FAD-dependent oxidoreductase [Nitrososphaeria archaeon]MDW7986669.1 NAD(P)/FAD-dependent oxidoreductase [Nitrososphaerota archaeon]
MKIAVVGIGVAGSYLLARLNEKYIVEGFEKLEKSRYFPICAWATSKNEMSKLCKRVGLNFDDYILYVGREMLLDLGREIHSIKLRGLCTFDKLRFEEDLIKDSRLKFGVDVRSPPPGYDLVIDATGFNRSLLPRIKENYFIPTVEYRVKFREPPYDDFYIKPFKEASGYLWCFPLGDSLYHVGAGDYLKRHLEAVKNFVEKHRGEVLMKIGRPIRITPPEYCQPIYVDNIVGVGEAIGTVYPMLGEGIIPSIYSAESLVENLENLENYRKTILKIFNPYSTVFEFIKRALASRLELKRDLALLFKIYLHMRFKEERYGIQARVKDFLKVIKTIYWRKRGFVKD